MSTDNRATDHNECQPIDSHFPAKLTKFSGGERRGINPCKSNVSYMISCCLAMKMRLLSTNGLSSGLTRHRLVRPKLRVRGNRLEFSETRHQTTNKTTNSFRLIILLDYFHLLSRLLYSFTVFS